MILRPNAKGEFTQSLKSDGTGSEQIEMELLHEFLISVVKQPLDDLQPYPDIHRGISAPRNVAAKLSITFSFSLSKTSFRKAGDQLLSNIFFTTTGI